MKRDRGEITLPGLRWYQGLRKEKIGKDGTKNKK
jgi:hypothetical protein